MQHLSKKLGFGMRRDTQDMVMKANLDLYQTA